MSLTLINLIIIVRSMKGIMSKFRSNKKERLSELVGNEVESESEQSFTTFDDLSSSEPSFKTTSQFSYEDYLVKKKKIGCCIIL